MNVVPSFAVVTLTHMAFSLAGRGLSSKHGLSRDNHRKLPKCLHVQVFFVRVAGSTASASPCRPCWISRRFYNRPIKALRHRYRCAVSFDSRQPATEHSDP